MLSQAEAALNAFESFFTVYWAPLLSSIALLAMLVSLCEPICHAPNQWVASAQSIFDIGEDGCFETLLYQGADPSAAQRVYFEALALRSAFPQLDRYLRGEEPEYGAFMPRDTGLPLPLSGERAFSWLAQWPEHPWQEWRLCFLDEPKLRFYDQHGRERLALVELEAREIALIEAGKQLALLTAQGDWSPEAARALGEKFDLAFALGSPASRPPPQGSL